MRNPKYKLNVALLSLVVAFTVSMWSGLVTYSSWANETGLPPDMVKITGQEDFVHIWTLGVEGVGDEQDKLVTVDVNPKSNQYGSVVHSLSVGGRNEAHHMGFTFDRRYLWGATLDTSKIFVFDINTDPARPRLIRTITDFVAKRLFFCIYFIDYFINFQSMSFLRINFPIEFWNSFEI